MKFSEVRENLFCEKSRILSNRENKLSLNVFLYDFFKCIFISLWEERTEKKQKQKNKTLKLSFMGSEKGPVKEGEP